ncbi:DMSO/selenate family reductase complex B subunit [Sporomusa sp.]|uniref:DMSO/selenate family reductase complex B subunit n=1 Tax=Sporomusa sp. TaxID=2078658 RepID=UPI002C3C6631|nr:DMSO/selenate family reductase complex B subunit [Sporomusa sp.]HWR08024.1 DMSO/selenate family reductase complex B subunit [Sporomusa sp.]
MGQKGFFYDMTACTGCKTCQIACKDKNNLAVGVLFRKVHSFEGGKYPAPWVYPLSISCNHCAKPECVAVCPTSALTKRPQDGIVTQSREKCIGCRACVRSCPYQAPQYIEKEGKAGKCDLCADLIDQGQNPACVDACLMRTLQYGDIKKLKKDWGGTADVKGLPDSGLTSPSLVIRPNKQARP